MKNQTKITLENNCLFISAPRPAADGVVWSVLHTPTGVESDDFFAPSVGEAFRLAQKVTSGEVTFWGGRA